MMLLLRCPGCKNTMKYQNKENTGPSLRGKAKRCVYCGKSYQVKNSVVKVIS